MNFKGFLRKNGSIGVRNHVVIFPTVICSSEIARMISQNMPGTVSVSHQHGCGHLGIEKDHIIRAMAGFCSNPNVAGVLLVGNGCEMITPEVIAAELDKVGQRYEIVSFQTEGGTANTLEKGKKLAARLIREAARIKPRTADISNLIVGVKCGGSDALSGLTANPALGAASDQLVAAGGTVIMTEVPEMLGAERFLAQRAASSEVKKCIWQITSEMEEAVLKMGVDIRGAEPSPGNMAGGLSSIEEKSLGAILKGGQTAIQQVVDYAEKPSKKGLIIMDGPALDPVANTGFLAAGAQVIVFTTGRGTPIGSAIAPVIKVSTNSDLYRRMKDNIDINAGRIVDGEATIQEVGQGIFQEIIEVASGKRTKSEILGHSEFAIHNIGPTL